MDGRGLSSVKTHKRKSKNLVDPGELVSEKSLHKSYKILGQVIYNSLQSRENIFYWRSGRGNWAAPGEEQEGQSRGGGRGLLSLLSPGRSLSTSTQTPTYVTSLNITRDHPPLPWRHLLLSGQSAQEAADEVPGHQDVLGQAEEAPLGPWRLATLWPDSQAGPGWSWHCLPWTSPRLL